MKIYLNRIIMSFFFALSLIPGGKLYASHIVGMDLIYTYVSGNTYTITLIAYGDCGPASAAAFSTLPTCYPKICIQDDNRFGDTLDLQIQAPDSGVEITPVCPADKDSTQCTNISYAIPGIKKFVYSAQYTLPYASATWSFTFTGAMGSGNIAGRAAAITNITPGSAIQISDTLNNLVNHNSSAVMTTDPVPFFCNNNSDGYNPAAVDPDGDSLSFSLITGISGVADCSGTFSPVTYLPPFSGAAPLSVVPGSFTFDKNSGQISFVPNVLQRALVVYNVDEFRHGAFVGSCQREMTFLVITCTDIPPTGYINTASAGILSDSAHFDICVDSGAYTLFINPTEADTNNQITVTSSGLPPGATLNILNNTTNHPSCTFSWTSTNVLPGNYKFYLTFKDNACPLSGTQTNGYTITVKALPDIHTTGAVTDCYNPMGTLTASGGVNYVWTPALNLSCTNCDSTISTAPVTTVYTVTVTDMYGCHAKDTASLQVSTISLVHFMTNVTADATINYGDSIRLNADGAVLWYWTPDNGTLSNANINNPVADPLINTTYTVYGYNQYGCLDTAQVTIDIATTYEVIPSAFTPNEDGLNDVFRVANLRYGKLVEMNIYNRWGQLVCKTTDNNKGWDGKFNGEPQDMGVYNYYIIVERENGKTYRYKGDLTLIR